MSPKSSGKNRIIKVIQTLKDGTEIVHNVSPETAAALLHPKRPADTQPHANRGKDR